MNIDELPKISIVIISKDRREGLVKLISSLKNLEFPKEKIEIIVVEETDKPLKIEDIKYIHVNNENKGFGYARNLALKNCLNEIIVFIDDDCTYTKDWLKELIGPFSDKEILGVAGSVRVKDCNVIGYSENVLGFPGGGLLYINKSNGMNILTSEISTLNAAYRKEAIVSAGGFQENAKFGGEDYLIAKEICKKGKCIYAPKAAVYHKVRGSLFSNIKWFIRRGMASVSIFDKVDSRLNFLLWLIRSSIIIKFSIITLVLYSITGALIYSILFFFSIYYAKNIIAFSFSYKYLKNIKVLFFTPILKFLMDVSMDIGRINYLLFNKNKI